MERKACLYFAVDCLSLAVDIAQIVSAVATAATVIVAVVLARRSEQQRLKFQVVRGTHIYIAGLMPVGRERKETIALTVVNAGLLPVQIQGALFQFPQLKAPDCRIELRTNGVFPQHLEHGQNVLVHTDIVRRGQPWGRMRSYWWLWNRPTFRVFTSVGKVYSVKPPRKLLRELKRNFDSGLIPKLD